MKKISCTILAVLVLLCSLCFGGSAAENRVQISSARVDLPDITVNATIQGDGVTAETVSLHFNDSAYPAASVEKYASQTHTRRVFFVMDLSTSMTGKYFSQAKSCVQSFAESMGENTTVYVISFGKSVDCVVNGSSNPGEIQDAVNALANNQGGTKFFAAIQEALDISKDCAPVDMEYMVVFSDGEDFQTGDTTQNEVETALQNSAMPIYAMRANTGRVSANDIGGFRKLVNMSNGEMYAYTSQNAKSVFSNLLTAVNGQYIIRANTKTNVFTGTTQPLYIKVLAVQSETVTVSAKSKTDTVAPQILSDPAISKTDKTMTFAFSEDILNAAGALPTKEDILLRGPRGKEVEVVDAVYANTNGDYLLTLYLKDDVVKQEYTLVAKGLTDNSIEKNLLPESYVFTSPVGISKFQAFVSTHIYLLFILLAVLLLVVLLLVMMRRKKVHSIKELFEDEHIHEVRHVVKSATPGRKIKLRIDAGENTERIIDFELLGSAVFGRSDMCNVVFDDTKMSRQHFCIGEQDGNLILSDLETTNGTYLNGVAVKSQQVLKSGDRIFAGLSTIMIEFEG